MHCIVQYELFWRRIDSENNGDQRKRLTSSATSLYVVVPFSSTFSQTFMLKWRNPLLGAPVVRVLLKKSPDELLMSLSTKAAALPSSSLTFFIGGMTAAEGESLRFIALGVVDDMLGIEALVRRVDVVVILLFSLRESKCFGCAESLSVMLLQGFVSRKIWKPDVWNRAAWRQKVNTNSEVGVG